MNIVRLMDMTATITESNPLVKLTRSIRSVNLSTGDSAVTLLESSCSVDVSSLPLPLMLPLLCLWTSQSLTSVSLFNGT